MIHIYMYLERLLSLGSDGDLDLLPLGGEREGEGDIFLPHNQHSQHKSNFNKYKIIVQQKNAKNNLPFYPCICHLQKHKIILSETSLDIQYQKG